jgi:hypothetical protein
MKLTPEQIDTLFGALEEMFQAARMEARALRQLLIEHEVFSEEELEARIAEVTTGEIVDFPPTTSNISKLREGQHFSRKRREEAVEKNRDWR